MAPDEHGTHITRFERPILNRLIDRNGQRYGARDLASLVVCDSDSVKGWAACLVRRTFTDGCLARPQRPFCWPPARSWRMPQVKDWVPGGRVEPAGTNGMNESPLTATLINVAVSAALQVLILAALPFLGYWLYHRRRHGGSIRETARRAGLQVGDARYIVFSLAFAVCAVLILIVWTPSLEPLIRPGSTQHRFVGLGLGPAAVTMALLHGAVQTAFSEEVLFRGLIAGSLSRRFRLAWANLIQALVFFLPHVAILFVSPELWPILPLVFAAALLLGWVRIRSESILGPWIMHGAGNVTMALLVAART